MNILLEYVVITGSKIQGRALELSPSKLRDLLWQVVADFKIG